MVYIMIDYKTYELLKEKYGHVSSWTVWKEVGDKATSNTGDMSIFDDENICNILNDKYVFVGLNVSNTHGIQEQLPWKNFHSSYKDQQDFKLRYALMNTKFWGSYITDIIKEYSEVYSKKVKQYLKKHPEVLNKNIEIFKDELKILTEDTPILIALGDDSYDILKKNLSDKYEIVKIKHYSYRNLNKEEYRKAVLDVLKVL